MIIAALAGTSSYLVAWAFTFAVLLVACGGRGPSCPPPRHAASADAPPSRTVTCEVRP